MLFTLGVTLQALSIYCLKAAKRRKHPRALSLAAALAFTCSGTAFVVSLGIELGVAYALTTISLVAYAIILWPILWASAVGHERARTRAATETTAVGQHYRFALRLLSAGPLYLMCALALSLLIATQPWSASESTRLFTGGLLCPVLWAIGALHATTDANVWRTLYLPAGLTGLATIAVAAL